MASISCGKPRSNSVIAKWNSQAPTLGQLRESQDLLDNSKSLRQRLRDDGFLLLRGLIDRSLVSHARRTVLAHMQEKHALVPNTPMLEGVMPNGGHSVQMMGRERHCASSFRSVRFGKRGAFQVI